MHAGRHIERITIARAGGSITDLLGIGSTVRSVIDPFCPFQSSQEFWIEPAGFHPFRERTQPGVHIPAMGNSLVESAGAIMLF